MQCAKEVGATWDVINQCSISQEGSELLKQYGEETHSLNPSVSFIPTITLDKSQGDQKDILKDLLKEVCSRYKVSLSFYLFFFNLFLSLDFCRGINLLTVSKRIYISIHCLN